MDDEKDEKDDDTGADADTFLLQCLSATMLAAPIPYLQIRSMSHVSYPLIPMSIPGPFQVQTPTRRPAHPPTRRPADPPTRRPADPTVRLGPTQKTLPGFPQVLVPSLKGAPGILGFEP
ncbi:hypothetical protein MBM_01180 [Drepanopeziza brunnea f. sp. 'multigermtubi' MB_m1]|uniref:Uncharacterized protein n=1 Tax=Marssonina brunnea f. sp. multigermtubi (strain MB_m1) TaxID=1072389 RepID=K1XID5_MARBU|nr:uncharacterized protein MBM_01180 [Drepanopeziza brunnea f. sp. 'multigermtubi' MB_m1]EKD20498.1 hypothetical protein MBM_01180 [Drepanopeziza brunnea f. sp. 'multigermtubi' MB_m1]